MPPDQRKEQDVTNIQRTFESTFSMASNILKELNSIHSNNAAPA